MPDFFWFSDAQWARIGPLLPTDTRGMARVDDRRVLSGIVHALRNGGRWADCPREVYGPKKTLYNRFVRWAERGIWERIFSALAGGEDAPDRLFIDSTCIKVHPPRVGSGQIHRSDQRLGLSWHQPLVARQRRERHSDAPTVCPQRSAKRRHAHPAPVTRKCPRQLQARRCAVSDTLPKRVLSNSYRQRPEKLTAKFLLKNWPGRSWI